MLVARLCFYGEYQHIIYKFYIEKGFYERETAVKVICDLLIYISVCISPKVSLNLQYF